MNFLHETSSKSSSESNSDNSEQSSSTQEDPDEKYKTILGQICKPMITMFDSYNNWLQEQNQQEQNTNSTNTQEQEDRNCTNYQSVNTPYYNSTNNANLHLRNNGYKTNYSPQQEPSPEPNTPSNVLVSQDYIINNAKLYGKVIEKANENCVQVILYRCQVALTSQEIEMSEQILHPIDIQKQSMYRCPLKSCQHKPLNNLYIRKHIKEHCDHYHYNNNKNYHFLYQTSEKWKSYYYPPLPTLSTPINHQYNQTPIDNNGNQTPIDNNDKNHNPISSREQSTTNENLLQSVTPQSQITRDLNKGEVRNLTTSTN